MLLGSFVASYLLCAVVIDPRGYFNVNIFPVVTLDSRLDKMKLFVSFNQQRPVEGLVLGSSRSMKICPSELLERVGQRFFNFSVDSARVEDYVALYRWARSRDPQLKTVLIALDVEALHDDDQLNVRLKNNPALMWALDQGARRSPAGTELQDGLCRLKEIFSRHYTRDMVLSVLAPFRPRDTSFMTFDIDGFLHYPLWEREVSERTFSLRAHVADSREEYKRRFGGMLDLSKRRRHLLEELFREARRDGVVVVLWITPIHPDVADYLSRETRYRLVLEKTRTYVNALRVSYGIRTYDFSSPALFGGTNSGWYDGAHIDATNASVIAVRLSAGLK